MHLQFVFLLIFIDLIFFLLGSMTVFFYPVYIYFYSQENKVVENNLKSEVRFILLHCVNSN